MKRITEKKDSNSLMLFIVLVSCFGFFLPHFGYISPGLRVLVPPKVCDNFSLEGSKLSLQPQIVNSLLFTTKYYSFGHLHLKISLEYTSR